METLEASNTAKAEFVRAFYDAVDKLVQSQSDEDDVSAQETSAIRELEEVIFNAKQDAAEEFAAALQFASLEYFSRVTQAQTSIEGSEL